MREVVRRRWDSGFFTFGQLYQSVRKLSYWSLLPKFVPRESDWTRLGELQTAELRQLYTTQDLLIRRSLKTDLDAAANAEAGREMGEQKCTGVAISELATTYKEEFASRARSYLMSLLEEFLNHHSLNADIVKGMAAFDLHVLLGNFMEQATFFFVPLFRSCSLRCWLEDSTEANCRDEYMEFVDFSAHSL